MSRIPNDYLLIWYLSQQYNEGAIPNHFMTKSEAIAVFENAISIAASALPGSDCCDIPALARRVFIEIDSTESFPFEADPYAGVYVQLDLKCLREYRRKTLESSPIFARMQKVGPRLISDALAEIATLDGNKEADEDSADDFTVPASDRIVTLNDNQFGTLAAPLNAVIEQFEQTNGDPDRPGLRERILGQLKAGRELLNAGTFKIWLLQQTVLNALGELIERYGATAVGAAAKVAWEVFVEFLIKGE